MSVSTTPSQIESIARKLRTRVMSGEWKALQQIDSEFQLAKEFGVCRATITKSLKELEREGLFWSRRGKGRFVVDIAARQKTWTLGVILADLDRLGHPEIAGLLAGMREAMSKSDYHLKLLAINQSSGGSAPMSSGVLIMDLIDPDRIDGAIVMTREVPQEQVEALAAKIPVVWLGHESILPRIAGVQNDVIGGAYDAARHLAALGHRNISLVTIAESFAQGRDQRRGVRLGLRDLLTQGDATLNVWEAGRNSTDDGHRLGREFLAKPDRPTAVICGSDELAVGVYRAASEIGLQVPGQLSIIGWNDSPILEAIPVPMTSVRIDHKQLGAASVQHVRKLIETPYASEESELLPVELIVRKSTAAPDSSLSADGKPAHSQ